MPDAVQDAVQAPENKDAEKAPVSPLGLQDFLTKEGAAVDAQINVPAFEEGVVAIVAAVPNVKKAEGVHESARMVLARAMIACRNAVTYKGRPDTFGASKIYKALFKSWIVETVVYAHPTMEVVIDGETKIVPTDRDWVKNELDYVRINYLGSSATRAKGLLFQSVIQTEAAKLPGATIAADGTVTVPQTQRRKVDGKMVDVPKVEKVKTEDGTILEIPVVATYKPGQTVDVPGFAKKIVQNVVETAAPKKKDAQDPNKMVSTVDVPVWFGGAEKEKGTGGGKSKGPADYAKMFRDAWETIVTASDHIAADEMLQWVHASLSSMCNTLNKPGLTNPKEKGQFVEKLSKLLHAEAALLEGHQSGTLEKVAELQFKPEDAEKAPKAAPKEDAEDAEDAEGAPEDAEDAS